MAIVNVNGDITIIVLVQMDTMFSISPSLSVHALGVWLGFVYLHALGMWLGFVYLHALGLGLARPGVELEEGVACLLLVLQELLVCRVASGEGHKGGESAGRHVAATG